MEGHDPRRNIQETETQGRNRPEPSRHERDLEGGPERTRVPDQESATPTSPEVLPQNPEAVYNRSKANYHKALDSGPEQYGDSDNWHRAVGRARIDFEQSFESLPPDTKEVLVPTTIEIVDIAEKLGNITINLPELVRGTESSMRLQRAAAEIQIGRGQHPDPEYSKYSASGDGEPKFDYEKLANDWILSNRLLLKTGNDINHLIWSCGENQEKRQQQIGEIVNRLDESYKKAIEHGDARVAEALAHFDRECEIGLNAKVDGNFMGIIYPGSASYQPEYSLN